MSRSFIGRLGALLALVCVLGLGGCNKKTPPHWVVQGDHYKIDLTNCASSDSAFIGVVTGISIDDPSPNPANDSVRKADSIALAKRAKYRILVASDDEDVVKILSPHDPQVTLPPGKVWLAIPFLHCEDKPIPYQIDSIKNFRSGLHRKGGRFENQSNIIGSGVPSGSITIICYGK